MLLMHKIIYIESFKIEYSWKPYLVYFIRAFHEKRKFSHTV